MDRSLGGFQNNFLYHLLHKIIQEDLGTSTSVQCIPFKTLKISEKKNNLLPLLILEECA